MIFPSLNQKFLSPPEFFWNTELFPLSCSGNARQKNIRRKKWYPKRIHEKFSMQEVLFKEWSVPIEIFLVLWDKKIFVGETWYPPRIQKIFSLPEIFWNNEEFPMNFFDNLRQKTNLTEICVTPRLVHMFRPIAEFFWNHDEFPMKVFDDVRQKNIDEKTWYPLLSSINFSRHQNFSGTPNCSHWVLSVLWDKKNVRRERWFLQRIQKIFRCKTFLKLWTVPSEIFC